jgi:hypothetical protein
VDLLTQLQTTLGTTYTLDRELGGGGMSRVFVASERRLNRKVVIKVVSPELAAGVSGERFEREIQLAASLQQANIVPILARPMACRSTRCRLWKASPCGRDCGRMVPWRYTLW